MTVRANQDEHLPSLLLLGSCVAYELCLRTPGSRCGGTVHTCPYARGPGHTIAVRQTVYTRHFGNTQNLSAITTLGLPCHH